MYIVMSLLCPGSRAKPLPMYLYDTAGLAGSNIRGMDVDS